MNINIKEVYKKISLHKEPDTNFFIFVKILKREV